MNFELHDDQSLLKSTLNNFLKQRYDFESRVKASREAPGYRLEIWKSFATDLGILGVGIAEEFGGTGGGEIEQMLIMEELGRALVIEPVAETVFQCGKILSRTGKTDLLPDICKGDVQLALATGEPGIFYDFEDIATNATKVDGGWRLSGEKSNVVTAPWATHYIIAARSSGEPGDADGLSLFLVERDAPGISLSCYPTIDGRQSADLRLDNVMLGPDALIGEVGQALLLLEEIRDRTIAMIAAEATGVLERLVEDTVNYSKERKQFNQPIGSFQVLQHRMVDMYLHLEMTRSASLLVNLKLNGPPVERALAASAAKVTVAEACRFVGQNAVQLHGGMGMTDELPIGHYFKRTAVMENEQGSSNWHVSRHKELTNRRCQTD